MNLEEYVDFINERWAPCPTTLPEVEWRWHVNHAAIGIAGEALELIVGISFNNETLSSDYVTKELGDLLFYTIKAAHLFNMNMLNMSKAVSEITSPKIVDLKNIITHAERLADNLKKVGIYGQNAPSIINETPLFIIKLLTELHLAYGLEELAQSNAEKLRKRYQNSFTVEESITRKDECLED